MRRGVCKPHLRPRGDDDQRKAPPPFDTVVGPAWVSPDPDGSTRLRHQADHVEGLAEGEAGLGAAELGSRSVEANEALALIRALPEAYRETLVLRLVEGMTGPEIAERTGLTAASVRVNLHRGMKLLRERLGFMEGL